MKKSGWDELVRDFEKSSSQRHRVRGKQIFFTTPPLWTAESPSTPRSHITMMDYGMIKVSTEMTDQEASPEPGSARDSVFSSDHQEHEQHSADDSSGPNSVKAELGEDGASASGSAQRPVQKRRRVTRACDECRRKKIKCDGKQPCTHCSVYSYGRRFSLPINLCFLTNERICRLHI